MFARAVPFVIPVPSRRVLQTLLSMAAAALVIAACHPQAKAADVHTIVVPADDGYGFGDCLEGGRSCGRVVADAWCEANGLATSVAFGRAEDVTGAIKNVSATKIEPGSFLVTCNE